MLLATILLYAVSLLYLCSVERFRYYATIIGLQGWFLFLIAILVSGWKADFESVFLFSETSLVKGLLIPYMLFRIIKKTHVNHVHRHAMPPAFIVSMALLSLVISAMVASQINIGDKMQQLIFGLALFGMFVGLILITTHRRIFSHLVGFLALENSMFLFSTTLRTELPFLVDIAVAIDIMVGVLVLGFVVSKVSEHTGTLNSDKLSQLRD